MLKSSFFCLYIAKFPRKFANNGFRIALQKNWVYLKFIRLQFELQRNVFRNNIWIFSKKIHKIVQLKIVWIRAYYTGKEFNTFLMKKKSWRKIWTWNICWECVKAKSPYDYDDWIFLPRRENINYLMFLFSLTEPHW